MDSVIAWGLVLSWFVIIVHSIILFMLLQTQARQIVAHGKHQGPSLGAAPLAINGHLLAPGDNGPHRVLLICFLSVRCRLCADARDVLTAVARNITNVGIVVSCEGEASRVAAFASMFPPSIQVVADPMARNSIRWRVRAFPFCVIVADGRIRDKIVRVSETDLRKALSSDAFDDADLIVTRTT